MNGGWRAKLLAVIEYFGILFSISFVLTASFALFFQGLEIPEEAIKDSAVLTFANALFIAFLMWLIGRLRKKVMIDRPVKRISDGLEKLTEGDFSERIEPFADPLGSNQYNIIIERINKMADELAGVETLRTDFVSNVSHEMKTPLAVIQNYAALLRSPNLSDDDRMGYAAAIDEATKRLAALITNILKLNKLENQQIFPENKVIDLSELVCECMLEFENEWEKKNIGIETDIDDGIMISADPELLSLVWNNLFSNAIKFTDEGGKVSVAVKRTVGGASVSVTDTGCGIDSETGRHIFDKFYQGDTSHASGGNGLGLALVKRIIDITGCEIRVSSELGRGSTFTVILHDENGGHNNE
ncbi:Signal transduction histidine kinase [Ruminococcus sp. YE71]|uniref:HAMP domain-containing sensor histidine kinase n=1 Tax=unclassified Ruminococcus TaxID=2608920 RepID=UPI000882D40F|nr:MULTISPECIES: HAMP domain-containing sensor histidine kinase [unclassified Ruminococcus]SDA25887.1 Signal transduction histidine kinase [Ruminococcus sp. YE78]SFW35558.1 Signal transduction histidine kinase [Ruminococcus sp. YE71]